MRTTVCPFRSRRMSMDILPEAGTDVDLVAAATTRGGAEVDDAGGKLNGVDLRSLLETGLMSGVDVLAGIDVFAYGVLVDRAVSVARLSSRLLES